MSSEQRQPSPQKVALEKYLSEVKASDLPLYTRRSKGAAIGWEFNWWSTVCFGFISAVAAAIAQFAFPDSIPLKVFIIILPAWGTLSALLLQSFAEAKIRRDSLRQRLQSYLDDAERFIANANDPVAIDEYHSTMIKNLEELNQEQLSLIVGKLPQNSQGSDT